MSTATADPEAATDATETQIEGVAAAALLAAGCGALVLGLMTTFNEISSGLNDFLRFDDDVGPLSGKTIIAVIAYFAVLVVMSLVWRGRQLRLSPILWTSAVLLVLGFIGTFPTFFEIFAD